MDGSVTLKIVFDRSFWGREVMLLFAGGLWGGDGTSTFSKNPVPKACGQDTVQYLHAWIVSFD